MDSYATNIDRKKVVIYLTIISIVFSFIFNQYVYPIIDIFLNQCKIIFPDLYDVLDLVDLSVGPLTYGIIFLLLWYVYDRKIWKVKIKSSNLMPNINGKWEGTLISSYKNIDANQTEPTKRIMKMTIIQSYSCMSVECEFFDPLTNEKTSSSKSDLIGLFDENGFIILKFSYDNHSKEISTLSKQYSGYNYLKINRELNKMDGFYYTGRDSGQNHGNIELIKKKS